VSVWDDVVDECPRGRWRESTASHSSGKLRHVALPAGDRVWCVEPALPLHAAFLLKPYGPSQAQRFAELAVLHGLTKPCPDCWALGRVEHHFDNEGKPPTFHCTRCGGLRFLKSDG
jgi:hypothetical protein